MKTERFSFIRLAVGCVALVLSSYIKIQGVYGNGAWSFSASQIIVPLIGVWCGTIPTCLFIIGRRIISCGFLSLPFFSPFSTYIPTMSAVFYWSNWHGLFRYIVPLVCITAFVAHPIGSASWLYAMYWLIPLVIYHIASTNFFLHALAVTFIQHGVGSVIWLYTMESTPAFWYSLLPVVAIERLSFAIAMWVGFELLLMMRQWWQNFRTTMILVRSAARARCWVSSVQERF